MEAVARYFKFAERGTNIVTEARAGLTTFMVMAYIIFLNGNIIAKPLGLDPIAVAAGTCLVAGVMTIAMGVVANYPFALAAGLGINAIVAFSLPAKGYDAHAAMGVIVIATPSRTMTPIAPAAVRPLPIRLNATIALIPRPAARANG